MGGHACQLGVGEGGAAAQAASMHCFHVIETRFGEETALRELQSSRRVGGLGGVM